MKAIYVRLGKEYLRTMCCVSNQGDHVNKNGMKRPRLKAKSFFPHYAVESAHKNQSQGHHLPKNGRPEKRKILELALLIGAGAGFKPIPVLILDNGVIFRLCERVALALSGGSCA